VNTDSCLQVAHFALEAGNSTMSKAGTENIPEGLNSIPGSFSAAIFFAPSEVSGLAF